VVSKGVKDPCKRQSQAFLTRTLPDPVVPAPALTRCDSSGRRLAWSLHVMWCLSDTCRYASACNECLNWLRSKCLLARGRQDPCPGEHIKCSMSADSVSSSLRNQLTYLGAWLSLLSLNQERNTKTSQTSNIGSQACTSCLIDLDTALLRPRSHRERSTNRPYLHGYRLPSLRPDPYSRPQN